MPWLLLVKGKKSKRACEKTSNTLVFSTFTNTLIQDPEESLTEEPELDGIEDWFVRQEAKVNIFYMER